MYYVQTSTRLDADLVELRVEPVVFVIVELPGGLLLIDDLHKMLQCPGAQLVGVVADELDDAVSLLDDGAPRLTMNVHHI